MLEFMPEEHDEMTTALAALTLQVAVRAAVLGCDRDCASFHFHPTQASVLSHGMFGMRAIIPSNGRYAS